MEVKKTKRVIISRIVILTFISLLVLSGCATKVPINMLQPAQYHQASLTKTVAVLPFSGPGGQEFASEIEGVLASKSIDDKQYFTLVMSEQKFSQSALIDQDTAAKIGKLVGAQGIYTGAITVSKVKDSHTKEKRQECTQYEQKRDKKGNVYDGKCINWRNYTVSCTKRNANFSVIPKLIEVNTARILYSRNISTSADSSGCEDTSPPKDEQELLDKIKGDAKSQFIKDVAPYYITLQIKLMDSTDGIDSKEAKEKLKQGDDFADKRRMDQACELWGQATLLAPNSPAISYNLGVCAESRGDHEAALTLYKKADKLIGKPDDDVTLALGRVESAIKNKKKLAEQLKSE
jgi:tetratricopeptide (TPR) repeat protein